MITIYITEKTKENIEKMIDILRTEVKVLQEFKDEEGVGTVGAKLSVYEELLKNAVVMPDEADWECIQNTCFVRQQMPFSYLEQYYPNGLIIKP